MRYGIVGSRDWPDLKKVADSVNALPEGSTVVSGGARGVDRKAEFTALERGLDVVSFRVGEDEKRGLFFIREFHNAQEYRFHSRIFGRFASAAFYRNGLIVNSIDVLMAFHFNGSRGTQDTITQAREKGLEVMVYEMGDAGDGPDV